MIFLIKNNLKNILKNKLNCINKRSLIYDTKKKINQNYSINYQGTSTGRVSAPEF
jgi:hypothetical protein